MTEYKKEAPRLNRNANIEHYLAIIIKETNNLVKEEFLEEDQAEYITNAALKAWELVPDEAKEECPGCSSKNTAQCCIRCAKCGAFYRAGKGHIIVEEF